MGRPSLVFWSVSRPSAPGQNSWWNCVQTEEAAACPHRRLEHTHKSEEAFYRVWASFSFSFFSILFLSVCFSLLSSLSASACMRKTICFKTRAKYYHIYIFLFQEGSKGGDVWCGVFCLFSFFFVSGKVLVLG